MGEARDEAWARKQIADVPYVVGFVGVCLAFVWLASWLMNWLFVAMWPMYIAALLVLLYGSVTEILRTLHAMRILREARDRND